MDTLVIILVLVAGVVLLVGMLIIAMSVSNMATAVCDTSDKNPQKNTPHKRDVLS